MICIETSVPATEIPRRLLRDRKRRKLEHSAVRVSTLSAKREAGVSATTLGRPLPMMLTSGATGRVRALFSLRALRSLLLLLNGILLLLLLPFRRRAIVVSAEEKRDASLAGRRGGDEKRESVLVRVPSVMVPRRSGEMEASARRAMSIGRIGMKTEGDVERSVRDFTLFSTARGDTLFTQSWTSVFVRTK